MYVYLIPFIFTTFLYYVNDVNLFIICGFRFMAGSMSVVMLLICYLPMTMLIMILSVVLYTMCNLIIV